MSGTIAAMQAVADTLDHWNLGYDQNNRWDIKANGECDCSTSSGWIAKSGGYPIDLTGTFYTGNFAAKAKAAGFSVLKFTGLSAVRPGDFLLTPGHHVVFVRDSKRWFSAENDEHGKAAGGATGDQTGREVRYRAPYLRPGGWAYIVRPPAEVVAPKPPVVVPPPVVAGPLVVLMAAQESPRFGGSLDFAARGVELKAQEADVIGLTETTPDMRKAILATLGTSWRSVAHKDGAIALLYDSARCTQAATRQVAYGDRYHGALCVALRYGSGKADFIIHHTRPASVATSAQQRGDVGKALTLIGKWSAVLMGDFNMDADALVAARALIRATPDADTLDKAGVQKIDAIYVQKGRLTAAGGKIIDPGKVSDHLWPFTTITN